MTLSQMIVVSWTQFAVAAVLILLLAQFALGRLVLHRLAHAVRREHQRECSEKQHAPVVAQRFCNHSAARQPQAESSRNACLKRIAHRSRSLCR